MAKREEKNRLLFAGYLKENTSYTIPTEIIELMFTFYFISHAWSERYSSTTMDIFENQDGHSMLAVKGGMTAYSDNVVAIGAVHQWTIVMDSLNGVGAYYGYPPYIGIIKDNDQILNHWKGQGNAFWFWHHGYQFCCGNKDIRHSTMKKEYGQRCDKRGDVITVRLDLINFTVSFTINSKDYGIAFEDIEQCSYRLALTMPAKCQYSRFQLI